jgi:mono/diheme cytochrome c family protein
MTTGWYSAVLAKEKTKEEVMKKILSVIAVAALLCLTALASRAQDSASGEKTFKAKCVGCHGANGEGKPAMKSPSIKGKSADDITKAFASSPKHASVKTLTSADVKDLAAYLATLK